ncbi:MAG: hypothetical protein WC588_00825 [Candidatus Micrarchaeia archaeon]
MAFGGFMLEIFAAGGIGDVALSLFAVSIAVMASIIALAYMASQFFRKPEYEGFVTLEIYQLIVSVLLFVSIGGVAVFANSLMYAFSGSDPINTGRAYLSYVSEQIALPVMVGFETLKLAMQFIGSISMRWGASVWGVVMVPFGACQVLEKVADVVLMISVPFISSLQVQMVILEMIEGLALSFVLPAGALLRIFPPTRDAGTFLMCSALAALTVYPFTYVMHDKIVRVMVSGESENPTANDMLQSQNPGFARVMSASWAIDPEKMLFRPLRLLSYLVLQGAFLPALSMVITISFIKGTTKFVSQKFG